MSSHRIAGIHHITAIASDPQRNVDFYTQVLGLRLVKLTVNFDDPGTYHLYFGNETGTPGSILTFFPWPGARRGTIGNSQVSATAFAVTLESFEYWTVRLAQHHVDTDAGGSRFGERVVRFVDPDGLPLEIIATPHADPAHAWRAGPVPRDRAICGFHSATLSEEGYEQTAELLELMGFMPTHHEENRFRYSVADGPAATIDVVCSPDGRVGRLGAGTVHHIAFRTPADGEQQAWRDDLADRGYNVTPVIDRIYFHSIYFREPGHVLFEIATDPPGFAVDEPNEHLGETLKLPTWLEPHRSELERRLPPLIRTRPEAYAQPTDH
jgi:glyoxalase family protein